MCTVRMGFIMNQNMGILRWYWATGNPILGEIRQRLKVFALDDRVKGFSDLYCQYIEAAQKQGDEELLLENLFAVPEQMRREFSMFGFLSVEAVSAEENWESFEVPKAGECLRNCSLLNQGSMQFQNFGETGFNHNSVFAF